MERHPNRESVIGLYLRDHLGTDKDRISENPSTGVPQLWRRRGIILEGREAAR